MATDAVPGRRGAVAGLGLLVPVERTPVFGFKEPGLASRVAEVAAVLLLAGYFAARFLRRAGR